MADQDSSVPTGRSAASPAPASGKTEQAKTAAPAAKPAAAAKAAPAPSSGGFTRRGFFSWAAVGWVGFSAAIGGCMAAFNRFLYPNVLFEPPTRFKVGKPEDFADGVVDTRFKESHGVWIINSDGRIYCLIAVCTHLGCPPNWLPEQNKFKCPCHGSGYYKSGINFEGPTPRPLERAAISIDPQDGQLVVDKARKFLYGAGQWDDPAAYVPVG